MFKCLNSWFIEKPNLDVNLNWKSRATEICMVNFLSETEIKNKCLVKGSNTQLYQQQSLWPPKPNWRILLLLVHRVTSSSTLQSKWVCSRMKISELTIMHKWNNFQ